MSSNCCDVEELEKSRAVAATQVLNFSPVRFEDAELTVGCLPYGHDGKQALKQLRRDHNGTHVFRRDGPDTILAVSIVAGAAVIGHPKTIRLKENIGLAAALVRNALLTYLAGMGRTVLSYDPMEFIARDDLLRQLPGISPPDWLGVRLLYGVGIRPAYFFKQEPFIAAVVDVRTTRLIDRTIRELMDDGLSVEGAYVGRRVPSEDVRIAPFLESLGCVKSRNGPRVRLTDFRDGIESVEASEVWPSRQAFATCLNHVFAERAPKVVEFLESRRAALRHGPTRLDRIKKIVGFFGCRRRDKTTAFPPVL